MSSLESTRLALRIATPADAPFIFALLNSPGWLEHIGDRGIRTLDDAEGYINGLAEAHKKQGFGLWLVCRKEDDKPLGLCGLLQRDYLEHPDLGFAIAPEYGRQGYTREASEICLDFAREQGYPQVMAITSPANTASQSLLLALGFADGGKVSPPGSEEVLKLYQLSI